MSYAIRELHSIRHAITRLSPQMASDMLGDWMARYIKEGHIFGVVNIEVLELNRDKAEEHENYIKARMAAQLGAEILKYAEISESVGAFDKEIRMRIFVIDASREEEK